MLMKMQQRRLKKQRDGGFKNSLPFALFLLACRILQETLHNDSYDRSEDVPHQSNPPPDQRQRPFPVRKTYISSDTRGRVLLVTALRCTLLNLPLLITYMQIAKDKNH
jgi:hypothetical protein